MVEKQSGKTIDEIVYVPRIVHQKKFVEGPPEIQYKEVNWLSIGKDDNSLVESNMFS